ncbi:hypothetical protein HNQ36_001078 [Afipia massiliensis]|uniref:DUF2190 family protein n=1 Tax=Afipia massiliensis TaxID=211460 RepID=A0A840MXI2_9BRAD|nr:hypothetical protein [Afipia massiliensis]MBB5051124.1 hypothetical protein [Afipia massiliensis]
MSNFVPVTPSLGFPPIASSNADGAIAGRSSYGPWLGRTIEAIDATYGNGEFIFLKGVADTEVGSAVLYNPDDWSTSLLAANDIGSVAIAMSANGANKGGWYQIRGKAVVKAGTVSDNGNVYSTATAGTLDDAVVAGDRVKNAKFASANGTPSAGLAEIEIDHPFVDDAVAA